MCASPTAVRVRFGLPSDEIISICPGIIDHIFLSFHDFSDFFHQSLPLSRLSVSEFLSHQHGSYPSFLRTRTSLLCYHPPRLVTPPFMVCPATSGVILL
ncbi:hypothetical protein FRB95_001922 [Tulasnella sp. JGI-2019a]|nr:hypothetical protein FRB95_001922 [Tulasnella sp. JGI-2019a]